MSILAIAGLAACRGVDAGPPGPGADPGLPAVAGHTATRAGLHAAAAPGTARRSALAAAGIPAIPTSTQFDITGFLQEAHTAGSDAPGSLRVNGQLVTIPVNTVVILPASALTWDELFTQAPQPYGPTQTGLALFDTPAPLVTSEIHVIGNRVTNAAGGDQYIAGLVYLAQQSLNAGAGFINFIDYDAGELRVGGLLGDPSTGARVRINDPVPDGEPTGRYSKGLSPDPRFSVDQDNPTIIAATGYPMCLPRVAPPAPGGAETDPLCPQTNRPPDPAGNFAINFTMLMPAAGTLTDPRIQAPLEIGDYITYAGILVADTGAPTAGPWPGAATTYISAYSIVDNTAIYTAAGVDPAYVEIEVTLMGTGGLTALGVGEAAARTRFEGMSTDPSRHIHLYAIDLDPATGASSDRDLGTIGVDNDAAPGRWRFRPPCDPFGTVETPQRDAKNCVMNQAGTFLPPTREVRAVIEGLQGQIPHASGAQTAANGLFYGQYHGPILEYIFPENAPGAPIVPNNFETIPFLACGGITLSDGSVAGPLQPWPGAVAPVCANAPAAPVASAGPAQVVASGATVTLAGSATGAAPLVFSWAQTAGPTVALSDPAIATPSFVAPAVTAPTALTFALTVTNPAGSSTATVTITINASTAPTIVHIAPRTVASGTAVAMTATCSDPNGLACSFVWTQTSGTPVVLSPNPHVGATVSFTVALAAGVAPAVLQFQIVATNTAGVSSAPDVTTVTVTPPADQVRITNVEYRADKQRLIVTATSSVVSQDVILTLQPYVTATGTTFDPALLGNLFTNGPPLGTYTLTVVGAPQPAAPPATPLTARSSAGGISPPHGIDRLR
ncbi:MAG TPA: hypothetical protein VHT91_42780 [Kofleriaceae bacterium]|nr:hypothetical protein [Kofleriaceae bacterium]